MRRDPAFNQRPADGAKIEPTEISKPASAFLLPQRKQVAVKFVSHARLGGVVGSIIGSIIGVIAAVLLRGSQAFGFETMSLDEAALAGGITGALIVGLTGTMIGWSILRVVTETVKVDATKQLAGTHGSIKKSTRKTHLPISLGT